MWKEGRRRAREGGFEGLPAPEAGIDEFPAPERARALNQFVLVLVLLLSAMVAVGHVTPASSRRQRGCCGGGGDGFGRDDQRL